MIRLVLAARALRAFADGYVAVLLPAYLLALGHGELQVGLLSTVALAGGAVAAPLVACGVLKIAYDLALYAGFRKVAPVHA